MSPATTNTRRRILNIISILAILGVIVSSVSLQRHYATSKSSFCDFGATFNCDLVNRSIYSEILGIPVALIGIVGYATLFIVAESRNNKESMSHWLLVLSLVGLALAFYLTYIEGFVLGVWCVLCVSSLSIVLAETGLAGWLARKPA